MMVQDLTSALPVAGRSRPPPGTGIVPGNRTTQADPRWPQLAAALGALRDQGRHAVRIVDADCSAGALLIEAVRHARSLGFTAIEARGVDGSPAMIGRAHATAERLHDPAIGITFDVADMVEALEQEADFPADIVLWHGARRGDLRPGVAVALSTAGDLVIGDPACASIGRSAA